MATDVIRNLRVFAKVFWTIGKIAYRISDSGPLSRFMCVPWELKWILPSNSYCNEPSTSLSNSIVRTVYFSGCDLVAETVQCCETCPGVLVATNLAKHHNILKKECTWQQFLDEPEILTHKVITIITLVPPPTLE